MSKSLTPEKKIKFVTQEVFHKSWSSLTKYTYEYTLPDGRVQTQVREAYDRGNGITALLYHPGNKTVILTQQFRLPTYLNGNSSGLMIEACAGKLEKEDPAKGIIREIEEETGHRVKKVEKIFEAYMSPGSVTELIHFYLAQYDESTKISQGGGLESEQENIEVLEIPLSEALDYIREGKIKDGKTIMLLQYAQIHGLV